MQGKELVICEQLEEALFNGEPETDAMQNIAWANDLTVEEVQELWKVYSGK